MTEVKEKIVIIRETTVQSIISDIVTFGTILFSFWFNYKFIGGNDALDALLFIVFFLTGTAHLKNYKRFQELINDEPRKHN